MEAINKWKDSVLANFIKKNGEEAISKDKINHIIDWMSSVDGVLFHSKLQRISVPQALEHAEKWMAKLNKNNDNIQDLEGIEDVYKFPNGYKVVKLSSQDSYKKEGACMGHCVASYFTRADSSIYSLRDEDNQPHCTMELYLPDKEICQIKGKGNKGVVKKYHKYVKEFLEESKVDFDSVDTHEAANIGQHAAGRSIFSYDKEVDKIIELKGNVTWGKELNKQKVYPQILKIKGDFKMVNMYPAKTVALFSELHVSGDLYIENIQGLLKICEKLVVDGNVEIVDCGQMLKIADEAYIGKTVELSESREIKCIAPSGYVNGTVAVSDCPKFMKKPSIEIKAKLEIY